MKNTYSISKIAYLKRVIMKVKDADVFCSRVPCLSLKEIWGKMVQKH